MTDRSRTDGDAIKASDLVEDWKLFEKLNLFLDATDMTKAEAVLRELFEGEFAFLDVPSDTGTAPTEVVDAIANGDVVKKAS